MALATHVVLSFLWSVVCKRPVINVTLLTLKIATQNTRLMGYFPIVSMLLFERYMCELDITSITDICGMYFCSSQLLMLRYLRNCI